MSIQKIMSSNIVSVSADDTLETVRKIFDENSFHHLLVVDSGKLIGVISDRDLLKSVSPFLGTMVESYRDAATLENTVKEIMTREPVTLSPLSDIYEAVDVFNTHKVSCIPIVDSNNSAVGILSWRDIMKAIALLKKKNRAK